MIKIALIGCGKICTAQLNAIDTIPDAKVVAACARSEANRQPVCDRTGAVGYADYKEMIDTLKDELDLAIINLPHYLHGEATCYCAERGVDVFLEKPMGLDSADCQRMIDCCEKNGVMLWVGHIQRYFHGNMFAKELIRSGKYGELVSFSEVRNLQYFAENRPGWFTQKAMSGGGIMMNLGAHALDKIKYFTDANIAEITGQVHIHEGSDCEDSGQAFVKMTNGVTGTLNLIGHTKAGHYVTTLYLTKGEIRIDPWGNVQHCGEDGQFQVEEMPKVAGMTNQLQKVCEVIRDGSRIPVVDGQYGLDVIHAVKRLYGEEV